MTKHLILKKNIDDAVWLKKHTLLTLGCIASHVASDPPPQIEIYPVEKMLSNITLSQP